MAGVGIYAGVAGHSASVRFCGSAVGACWMEVLTVSRREQKGAKMKDDLEDIPMAYLLYVVLWILLAMAGAVIFGIRMF